MAEARDCAELNGGKTMTPQPNPSGGIISTAIDIFNRIIGRNRQPSDSAPIVDTAALQRYADYFDQQTGALIDQLVAGQITVDQWLEGMEKEISSLHTTAYVIGIGGIDQMSQDDLDDILATTETQDSFLRGWASQLRADVEAGKPLNAEALKARARMYRNAADATLQRATLAHVGLPDLPVPRDSTTQCLNNCLCAWRIQRLPGNGNYDCYWELGVTEDHCETCPNRAAAWNPLQIRAGQITPPLNYGDTRLFHRR